MYINPGSGVFNTVQHFDLGSEMDDTRSLVIASFSPNQVVVVGNAGQSNRMYTIPGSELDDTLKVAIFTDPNVGATFATVVGALIGTATDDTRSIAVADIDNDTDNDIIVTNSGVPSYPTQSDPTQTSYPTVHRPCRQACRSRHTSTRWGHMTFQRLSRPSRVRGRHRVTAGQTLSILSAWET